MNKRHYEHTLPNIRGSLSNTYVWTSANALHIRADRPAEAWVVGLSGASRARFAVVPGETRHALPAGVYLVRIADQTYKVRIRN